MRGGEVVRATRRNLARAADATPCLRVRRSAWHDARMRYEYGKRMRVVGVAALACYIATVIAANWLVIHIGLVSVGLANPLPPELRR